MFLHSFCFSFYLKFLPFIRNYSCWNGSFPPQVVFGYGVYHCNRGLSRREPFKTEIELFFCSEPVHIKKRKHESVIAKYEKVPRTLQTAPEKELIHLLPIKDKSGIIPQTREKPGELMADFLVTLRFYS